MVERTTETQPKARSYIIKRPRLTKLLDESGARIILLCAPAGYGKTTLAREWVTGTRRPCAWYRASPASADVVSLAAGVAGELDSARADGRFLAFERIMALRNLAAKPEVFARAISSSTRNLPTDLLLVIDDYHGVAVSPESDEFVGLLTSLLPVRVLITSRERPRWATPRALVYEGLELGAADLAMTAEEVREVFFVSRGEPPPIEVVSTAGGWPAIVGLAARTARTDFPTTVMPRRLYDFLAEDLVRSASAETRDTLTVMAVTGASDRQLVVDLLGTTAGSSIEEADVRGLLTIELNNVLGLHPLLREFLVERVKRGDSVNLEGRWPDILEHLARLRRWDECLSLLETVPQECAVVTGLIASSLEELLLAGRLQTVQRWVDVGHRTEIEDAVLDLAEGEIALRRGDYENALLFGSRAADKLDSGDDAARARLVAARAAHLSDNTAAAAEFFAAAESSAETVQTRAAALWGQFLSQGEQQDGYASATLDEFRKADDGTVDHELRCVHGRVLIALFSGATDEAVELLQRTRPLWSRATDPLVRLASLNQYAWGLGSLARYDDALSAAEELIDEASDWGLTFAASHALVAQTRALVGLRRFAHAKKALAQLKRRLIDEPDPWAAANAAIQTARLGLSIGDLERASDTLSEDLDDRNNPTTRAEYYAYRGLTAAARGDVTLAKKSIDISASLVRHLDSRAVTWFTEAIVEVSTGDSKDLALRSFRLARASGHADSIVIACRACPELAIHIASNVGCREALRAILIRSHDDAIARIAGIRIPRALRRIGALSPRELEVYELLAAGRTNPEIARSLYISESTAKVHVKHILEKLGVRSRVEAARAWRVEVE